MKTGTRKGSRTSSRSRPGRLRMLLVMGLVTLFGGAACFSRPYRPIEPLPEGIIDMHCHVAGIGAGGSGCFVSARLRHSWRFRIYLRSFGVSERQLSREGDRAVLERISEWIAG